MVAWLGGCLSHFCHSQPLDHAVHLLTAFSPSPKHPSSNPAKAIHSALSQLVQLGEEDGEFPSEQEQGEESHNTSNPLFWLWHSSLPRAHLLSCNFGALHLWCIFGKLYLLWDACLVLCIFSEVILWYTASLVHHIFDRMHLWCDAYMLQCIFGGMHLW